MGLQNEELDGPRPKNAHFAVGCGVKTLSSMGRMVIMRFYWEANLNRIGVVFKFYDCHALKVSYIPE